VLREFLTYIKKESFLMIAKKCFLIMRRLIDLGPKNTMLLLYHRWRKRRFMAKTFCLFEWIRLRPFGFAHHERQFSSVRPESFDKLRINSVRPESFDKLRINSVRPERSERTRTKSNGYEQFHAWLHAIFHDPAWRSTWPLAFHDTQAMCQKADATVARNFTILGFGTFKLSSPLPWQSDFISSPMRDIKVPWELSRFDYLFTLGIAYQQALKDNDHDRVSRYVHTFTSLITEWGEANPCYEGVNWMCPMEVAIRVINWIWGFYFFHKESMIQESFWEQFNTSLVHHAEYLYHTWEFSDRPNNHYLSDLLGFAYVSEFLGDTKRCNSVIKKLLKQINYQIHADGSCYEGSTAYHRLDTELVLLTILLLKHTAREVPAWLEERYERMQQFFADCSPTPESLVLIGDNDSGKIISGLWATGKSERSSLCNYPDFGLTIIKTKHWHITFRHATYRTYQPTGHFHNDQLAITLFDDGDSVFIDPGTISYTGDPQMRNALRSIANHNTFFIKDYEPENTRLYSIDLFVLPRRKHILAPEIIETKNSILVRDSHAGYAFLGLTAQRTIQVLSDVHEFCITDSWLGKIKKSFYSSWTFIVAPHVGIEKIDEKKWVIIIRDKERLIVESSLSFMIEQAHCSSIYGQKTPCYKLNALMACDNKEHVIRIKRFNGD